MMHLPTTFLSALIAVIMLLSCPNLKADEVEKRIDIAFTKSSEKNEPNIEVKTNYGDKLKATLLKVTGEGEWVSLVISLKSSKPSKSESVYKRMADAIFTLAIAGKPVVDGSIIWPNGIMPPFIQWYILKRETLKMHESEGAENGAVVLLKMKKYYLENLDDKAVAKN
ncbi:MAG: hypothetical protein EOP06_01955 [Proteobacteria bacterium]|nr:MAG: hypothetical protein EOP06_01955 [Pseudomonadota bacterium]